jgi:asparagine synthetase B (glutamine-hydrolysing)
MRPILGDYAIVFLDRINHRVVIAKDFFGKKSLLLSFTKEGGVTLSSQSLGVSSISLEQDTEGETEQEEV